jgi:hypothetical protein
VLALASCQTTGIADDGLQWTVGTWCGVRRGGDGTVASMTLRVEPTTGGVGQVECLRVDGASGPYVGFAVRMPDPNTGQWTMIYANAAQRAFARLVADRGVLYSWTSTTAAPGRGSRLVFERSDGDHWRRTQQVSEDAGRTWTVLFTDELVRDDGH